MRRVRRGPQRVKASEQQARERERQAAVSVFLAALPIPRGRLVTASSEVDSWRWKNPAIRRRLAIERAWQAKLQQVSP